MKSEIIKSWLAAGVVVMLMTGCDKKDSVPAQQEDRPIRMKAVIVDNNGSIVGEDITRGSVDFFANTPVAFAVKMKNSLGQDLIEHWNGIVGTSNNVAWMPQRSFDQNTASYQMRGYMPRINPANGDAISDDGNQITINLTGQEDLMTSDQRDPGTYNSQAYNNTAMFRHRLTQLRFTVVNDPTNLYPMEWIKDLWVYSGSGNAEDNTVPPLYDQAVIDIFPADPNSDATINFRVNTYNPFAAHWMAAYSIDAGVTSRDFPNGIFISPGTQDDVAKVMFVPPSSASDLRLYIAWGNDTENHDYDTELKVVNPDTGLGLPVVGNSYLVTLRFSNVTPGVGLTPRVTATSGLITNWSTGYINGSTATQEIKTW